MQLDVGPHNHLQTFFGASRICCQRAYRNTAYLSTSVRARAMVSLVHFLCHFEKFLMFSHQEQERTRTKRLTTRPHIGPLNVASGKEPSWVFSDLFSDFEVVLQTFWVALRLSKIKPRCASTRPLPWILLHHNSLIGTPNQIFSIAAKRWR